MLVRTGADQAISAPAPMRLSTLLRLIKSGSVSATKPYLLLVVETGQIVVRGIAWWHHPKTVDFVLGLNPRSRVAKKSDGRCHCHRHERLVLARGPEDQ